MVCDEFLNGVAGFVLAVGIIGFIVCVIWCFVKLLEDLGCLRARRPKHSVLSELVISPKFPDEVESPLEQKTCEKTAL